VLASLRRLLRYRALTTSLVARELRARYRGSVLGFLWTFVNPLLLLLVYAFVFGVVMPGARTAGAEPYPIFLFCGLLPWIWFETSLLESCVSLTGSGALLRKVLFPAEILPLVAVLTGFVNFVLGLVIVAGFVVWAGGAFFTPDLLWLPVVVAVQFALTTGLALLLSSVSVHFRDIRDILGHVLKLWFFGTPIVYPYEQAPERFRWILDLNPFTHLARAYQDILFIDGPYQHARSLAVVGVLALLVAAMGYGVFDRLRDTFAEEV
jgi:lipopolysaccharide transport system permease protein